MVSRSETDLADPRSFPRIVEYIFAFQLKTDGVGEGMKQKALFCYFCSSECFNYRGVGGGRGMKQKVLFRTG